MIASLLKTPPKTSVVAIYIPSFAKKVKIPFFLNPVWCGIPTFVDEYSEGMLDLNEKLIKNPETSFIVKVNGDSMIEAQISPDDHLIVDTSLEPRDGRIVIAAVNGELTVKRLCKRGEKIFLGPENPGYPGIEITEEMNYAVIGVVTQVIHNV